MTRASKTRAFLIEFVIMILFFSIAAVITLQLFLAAHEKSESSEDITMALIKMQNLAEELKADSTYIDSFFSAANGWDAGVRYYDENWKVCKKENASYRILAVYHEKEEEYGKLLKTELIASYVDTVGTKEDATIYTLTVKNYLPEWGE